MEKLKSAAILLESATFNMNLKFFTYLINSVVHYTKLIYYTF